MGTPSPLTLNVLTLAGMVTHQDQGWGKTEIIRQGPGAGRGPSSTLLLLNLKGSYWGEGRQRFFTKSEIPLGALEILMTRGPGSEAAESGDGRGAGAPALGPFPPIGGVKSC